MCYCYSEHFGFLNKIKWLFWDFFLYTYFDFQTKIYFEEIKKTKQI